MSSIMRRRSGLMAISVIGGSCLEDEVANSSILKTGRRPHHHPFTSRRSSRALPCAQRPPARAGSFDASDRTFAPTVARDVFDKLSELAKATNPAAAQAEDAAAKPIPRPANWEAITLSTVVLANEEPNEGWWEASVVGLDGDKLILRWLDSAREAGFTRSR